MDGIYEITDGNQKDRLPPGEFYFLLSSMSPTATTDYFKPAYEQYCELVEQLSSNTSKSWEHGELETYVNDGGTELMRRLLQGHFDWRYQQEGYQKDVLGSDGAARPHRRKKTQRQLETLFGEVVVTRVGYSTQKSKVSALYPSDGQLNLGTDKYSDGLRQRVAIEASKVSFSETSQTIGSTTGGAIGKRQCEEVTVKVSQDFATFYAQRSGQDIASANDLLVLSSDGKGIVMHAADLRPATAKAAKKARQSHQTRLSPGQKRQRKRMSTVATVYHVARYQRQPEDIIGDQREPPPRPAIIDKRVWASVEQDAKTVIGSAFEEALARDPQQKRDWVMLVDGEPHQLNSIKAIAKKHLVSVTIVLDFIHVLEYLWKASLCFCAFSEVRPVMWPPGYGAVPPSASYRLRLERTLTTAPIIC